MNIVTQPQTIAKLEQSEVVNRSDLEHLAKSRERSAGGMFRTLARAIKSAAKGEPFALEPAAQQTAREMVECIVEHFPYLNRDHLVTLLRPALDRTDGVSADDFDRMLIAEQSRVQAELAQRKASLAAPQAEPRAYPRTVKDVIVKADGIYYLRHPEFDVYQLKLKDDAALRLELVNRFGKGNAVLNLIDSAGRLYPTEEIMQRYGCNAHTIEKNFAVDATRFEFASAKLVIGHQMTQHEIAAFDEATHNWLTALAGGAVEELYDWIAATDQRHVEHPAAALAIVAPGDTGKSLFARALAQTWGALPVKLSNAVQQFNGSLQLCPIWHADEEMPKDLNGHEFRDFVASRDRLIEPKGKEKMLLRGSPRVVITVNELVDIRIKGANGPAAITAIADRLAVFEPAPHTEAALRALQLPQSWDVDLPRIVRHLRWVQCEIEPRAQRFLGARADKAAARATTLRSTRAECPKLFELLGEYLTNPSELEASYHLEERPHAFNGRRLPIVVSAGALYVRPEELAKELAPLQQDKIEAALRAVQPLAKEDRAPRRVRFGKTLLWFRRLDADALAQVLEFDAERWALAQGTLGQSTADRCPALKEVAAPVTATA